MRPSLPDPRELVGQGAQAVGLIASLVPRTTGLLSAAEDLMGRVDALVTRIEATRQDAQAVVERTDGVVTEANALIVRTAGTIASVEPTIDRGERLLTTLAPSLERLEPTLRTLADTTSPQEVQALVGLVDRLPHLAEALNEDILPILESLGSVAPDIHELLDVTRDLNAMIAKLPGMGLVRRRGDDQDSET